MSNIRLLEFDTILCKCINVWRFYWPVSIDTYISDAQIVSQNEYYVGPFFLEFIDWALRLAAGDRENQTHHEDKGVIASNAVSQGGRKLIFVHFEKFGIR